jgi:hypothetical protein
MSGANDPNELGALWSKQSAKGEYLTGKINGIAVVCFRNDKATVENKQPFWRVLRAQSKDQRERTVVDDDIGF